MLVFHSPIFIESFPYVAQKFTDTGNRLCGDSPQVGDYLSVPLIAIDGYYKSIYYWYSNMETMNEATRNKARSTPEDRSAARRIVTLELDPVWSS